MLRDGIDPYIGLESKIVWPEIEVPIEELVPASTEEKHGYFTTRNGRNTVNVRIIKTSDAIDLYTTTAIEDSSNPQMLTGDLEEGLKNHVDEVKRLYEIIDRLDKHNVLGELGYSAEYANLGPLQRYFLKIPPIEGNSAYGAASRAIAQVPFFETVNKDLIEVIMGRDQAIEVAGDPELKMQFEQDKTATFNTETLYLALKVIVDSPFGGYIPDVVLTGNRDEWFRPAALLADKLTPLISGRRDVKELSPPEKRTIVGYLDHIAELFKYKKPKAVANTTA
ncbi:MAG TPA: hypothetical protein VLF90_02800 [Patescibacteria group bacterium]|nr:hypothetical protein [Patescibacteria group bacterium]